MHAQQGIKQSIYLSIVGQHKNVNLNIEAKIPVGSINGINGVRQRRKPPVLLVIARGATNRASISDTPTCILDLPT